MIANVKRGYLIGMLVLTGGGTCLTVMVLLTGSGYRETEGAIVSAVSLGFLLLLAFAAYSALDHRWWRIPAIAGAMLTALMMLVTPLWAWWDRSSLYGSSYEILDRLTGVGMITAGLLCLVPWVMVPRLNALGKLVQGATAGAMLLLYGFSWLVIWDASVVHDMDNVFVALATLCGAGMLTVFVLNRFFGIKMPNPLTSVQATVWLKCPRCLKEQEIAAGAETRVRVL